MVRVAALLVVVCACNRAPSVDTCKDDLSGVWRGDTGRRYHAIRERGRVDIYPMFNAAHITGGTDYAPYLFGFARKGDALVGERVQRVTRKRNTCRLRTKATVTCADSALVLRYDAVRTIDWARCQPATTKPVVLKLTR